MTEIVVLEFRVVTFKMFLKVTAWNLGSCWESEIWEPNLVSGCTYVEVESVRILFGHFWQKLHRTHSDVQKNGSDNSGARTLSIVKTRLYHWKCPCPLSPYFWSDTFTAYQGQLGHFLTFGHFLLIKYYSDVWMECLLVDTSCHVTVPGFSNQHWHYWRTVGCRNVHMT